MRGLRVVGLITCPADHPQSRVSATAPDVLCDARDAIAARCYEQHTVLFILRGPMHLSRVVLPVPFFVISSEATAKSRNLAP